MAEEWGAALAGEREAALRFAEFPERARALLRRQLEALTGELLARVQGGEPQLSGKLRGETGSTVDDGPGFVRGRVRVAAPDAREAAKAGALEYGAQGSAQVPSHQALLTHVFGRATAPFEVVVEAYTRPMNLAARRYLRGPLDAMRGEIIERLRAALGEAAA